MRHKKLLTAVLSIAMVVCICFGFAACKKTNTKSSNATTNVLSNGGMVAKNGNTLYFIAGVETVSKAADGRTTASAIWKVETNDNGEFVGAPQVFVDKLVGYSFSSLYIFGDYLYYVTPSLGKDSVGNTNTDIAEFCRIPLSGGNSKVLYSISVAENDEMQYAYYKTGENELYLVVYENDTKNIVSVDIGTNPKATTIASNVTGIALAENGETNGANAYVFYTHAKDRKEANQNGNVVERILPNGSNKTTISEENKTTSLLCLRDGKLIYSVSDIIYAADGEHMLSTKTDKKVSMFATSTYDDAYITSTYIIVKTKNGDLIYISWNGDELEEYKICEEDETISFLCVAEERLFYKKDSQIYSVEIGENKTPIKLCEQAVSSEEGNLLPEVVGGYLYFMGTSESQTVLFRVLATATETQPAQKVMG